MYAKNKESNDISIDCFNIKNNQTFQNMLKRATSILDIHTNDIYMSFKYMHLHRILAITVL